MCKCIARVDVAFVSTSASGRRSFGSLPELGQRGGDPVGLGLMRGVEVMEPVEDLAGEVWKEAGEPFLHRHPPLMRPRPSAEVDGFRERGILTRLDPVVAQC